jgi:hypothetical protein
MERAVGVREENAMRHVLLVALVTMGFFASAACGSPNKPPMTPDSPEMGVSPDGGTDNPTMPSPTQPATQSGK